MRVLDKTELTPGKSVWLEDNGLAFKEMDLLHCTCIWIGKQDAVFLPFRKLDLRLYNLDTVWRCWDEKPDCDSLSEVEWEENSLSEAEKTLRTLAS